MSLPVPSVRIANNANRRNVNVYPRATRAVAGFGAGLIAHPLNARYHVGFPGGNIDLRVSRAKSLYGMQTVETAL